MFFKHQTSKKIHTIFPPHDSLIWKPFFTPAQVEMQQKDSGKMATLTVRSSFFFLTRWTWGETKWPAWSLLVLYFFLWGGFDYNFLTITRVTIKSPAPKKNKHYADQLLQGFLWDFVLVTWGLFHIPRIQKDPIISQPVEWKVTNGFVSTLLMWAKPMILSTHRWWEVCGHS